MASRLAGCEYPITVLFLVPTLVPGGAERQLIELVRNMDKSRFRPIVCCQKYPGEFFDLAKRSGADCRVLGCEQRFDLRFPMRLWKLLRTEKVRVIVTRGLSSYGIGTLMASLAGVEAIVKAEHSTGEICMGWGRMMAERLFIPLTDSVIAVAKGQLDFLITEKGIPEDRIVVIYNGIDLDSFTPGPKRADWLERLDIPEIGRVVGILAVLRPEKDHANLLRAASKVIQKRPDTYFVLAGDGPERGRLEKLAEELGVSHRVRFAGYVEDVEGILSTFDLAVLCSYTVETLPMAFIEAMAMKKPLVATDVGGLAEMIDEGKNGYLVPKKDSNALAEAILKVLVSDENIGRMGEHSRKLAELRFSAARMTDSTEAHIEALLCPNDTGG